VSAERGLAIDERKARGSRLGTRARTYEHGNLGVVNDVVADATKERAANSVQT